MTDNEQRAERAAVALVRSGYDDSDELGNILDLICDLAHLADTVIDPDSHDLAPDGATWKRMVVDGGQTQGAYAIQMGLNHYEAELAEARIEVER